MPRFPSLDPESVSAFDRASPVPMLLSDKAELFVREVRRQRAEAAKHGLALVPAPTKEQLVALVTWADRKEREGVAGLGQAASGAAGGAASGASVGMVAGPWGAAIGAVVGGIAGAFTGKSAEKKQQKATKDALKAAKTGLQAAQAQASGQTESARLLLEAEKVKAASAGKVPAWTWVAIAVGGVVLIGGGIFWSIRKRRKQP
jgi:hypothetical protein